jgi:hypothetical protein
VVALTAEFSQRRPSPATATPELAEAPATS